MPHEIPIIISSASVHLKYVEEDFTVGGDRESVSGYQARRGLEEQTPEILLSHRVNTEHAEIVALILKGFVHDGSDDEGNLRFNRSDDEACEVQIWYEPAHHTSSSA